MLRGADPCEPHGVRSRVCRGWREVESDFRTRIGLGRHDSYWFCSHLANKCLAVLGQRSIQVRRNPASGERLERKNAAALVDSYEAVFPGSFLVILPGRMFALQVVVCISDSSPVPLPWSNALVEQSTSTSDAHPLKAGHLSPRWSQLRIS